MGPRSSDKVSRHSSYSSFFVEFYFTRYACSSFGLRYTGLSPSMTIFSNIFYLILSFFAQFNKKLANPRSLATTCGVSVDFFFLKLLRCFSLLGFLLNRGDDFFLSSEKVSLIGYSWISVESVSPHDFS